MLPGTWRACVGVCAAWTLRSPNDSQQWEPLARMDCRGDAEDEWELQNKKSEGGASLDAVADAFEIGTAG